MVEDKKCLDTYALVEIAKENSKFIDYLKLDFVITDLTLSEFYFVLLREAGEEKAEYWFKKLQPYVAYVNIVELKEAMKFRYLNKNKNLSFFDCVGYIFSINSKFF